MDTLMAEAAKLKKAQPAGEPIRWSAGAPARARFICLRPRARATTEFLLRCLVCTEIDAAVAKAD
eukprot:scaffold92320_cov60-Phaeocystis_antarctica.AAC.1